MSAGAIKKVTVKNYEYFLNNLNDIIPKKITKKYFKLSGIYSEGLDKANVSRIVKVGDGYFALLNNKKLYYADDSYYFSDTNSGIHYSVPSVLSIYTERMEKAYLITSGMYTKVFNLVDCRGEWLIGGTFSAFYKGRIYIVSLSKIYVFKKFDYEKKCNSLEMEEDINLYDSTHPVGLFVIKGKLYLMTESSIYNIQYDGKLTNVTKLDILPLSIVKISVVRMENQLVCFMNNGRIFVFDGEKITVQKSMLDDMVGVTFTAFGGNASYYYINVTINDVNYTYAYNVLTGEELLSDYYKLLCDQSGIAINVTNNALARLSIAHKTVTDTNQKLSITEDLGYCGDKIITGFEIHVTGNGEIVVLGDFGEKIFTLTEGCNIVRCNMRSQDYTFKLQNLSSDFEVKNAKLKYRKCGD